MTNDQQNLLRKLEDVLQDINHECYGDNEFSNFINFDLFDKNIERVIDQIRYKI